MAFLFQISIGLPAFFVGLATHTYTPNTTSVAIHLLPPLAGGWAVRRTGLPPHALATALLIYLLVVAASFLFSPPALNVNLVFTVWPPIRRLASGRLAGLLLFHGVGPAAPAFRRRGRAAPRVSGHAQFDTGSITRAPSRYVWMTD